MKKINTKFGVVTMFDKSDFRKAETILRSYSNNISHVASIIATNEHMRVEDAHLEVVARGLCANSRSMVRKAQAVIRKMEKENKRAALLIKMNGRRIRKTAKGKGDPSIGNGLAGHDYESMMIFSKSSGTVGRKTRNRNKGSMTDSHSVR